MSNVKRQQTILSPITFHEYDTQRLPQEKKIYRENRNYFAAFKTFSQELNERQKLNLAAWWKKSKMSSDKLIGEQSVPRLRLWHIKEILYFFPDAFSI
jgi:hypothetical protein